MTLFPGEYYFKEADRKSVDNAIHVLNLNFDFKRHENSDMRISEKLDVQLVYMKDNKVIPAERFISILKEGFQGLFADSSLYSRSVYNDKVAKGTLVDSFILHESILEEIFLEF